MKWAVFIRPRAEEDLRQARRWYEAQRAGLGDELIEEVKRAIILLEDQPQRRPPYYRGFRRLLTRRFPYKLFYRLEGDHVVLFRILHAKRDHARWL